MCITDYHDMTLDVKVAWNPNDQQSIQTLLTFYHTIPTFNDPEKETFLKTFLPISKQI